MSSLTVKFMKTKYDEQSVTDQMARCGELRTGLLESEEGADGEVSDRLQGAAQTWPLGEILAARHDLQHSRIFNS